MAKFLYNSQDTLSDLMDFLAANGEQCQEAIDYGRALGNIKLGDFVKLIADDPLFMPDWAAYCYLTLPELLTPNVFAGFEKALNNRPDARKIIDQTSPRARSNKAMIRNG